MNGMNNPNQNQTSAQTPPMIFPVPPVMMPPLMLPPIIMGPVIIPPVIIPPLMTPPAMMPVPPMTTPIYQGADFSPVNIEGSSPNF